MAFKAGNVNFSCMLAEEYRSKKNIDVTYGTCTTKFGECLIAVYKDQICYICFFDEGKENSAIDCLHRDWSNAVIKEDNSSVQEYSDLIFNSSADKEINVLLCGTKFQCDVWTELTKIPEGSTVSYQDVANALQKPKAVRAVATAIASNKVAYVIPCHRVIRKAGDANKYRWGPKRKLQMLKYEREL